MDNVRMIECKNMIFNNCANLEETLKALYYKTPRIFRYICDEDTVKDMSAYDLLNLTGYVFRGKNDIYSLDVKICLEYDYDHEFFASIAPYKANSDPGYIIFADMDTHSYWKIELVDGKAYKIPGKITYSGKNKVEICN